MELYDVVMKLNGPISPVGETNEDNTRFQNLVQLTGLVDKLLTDIDDVILCKDDERFSVKRAGEHASRFFDRIGIKE